MHIICLNCGEPWDLHHVYRDTEPGNFERSGSAIRRCPRCRANDPEKFSKEVRERLDALYEMAGLLGGDDPDEVAVFLRALNLLDLE
jgi:hypothetical protein